MVRVARILLLAISTVVACTGPASPSASSSPPNVGQAVAGPFTLEITTPNRAYLAGEKIPVSASLTYTGPAASVQIGHALQVIGFGVDGLFDGGIRPIWALKCARTELQRGQPLVVPFAKTGASMTPNPSFQAFLEDPALRLPPGVWHVYAEASFSERGCADPGPDIRAEVVITVTDGSTTRTSESP